MAEYKRQHFVPQFYLRYFSDCTSRKAINLFNIKSGKFVAGASIRKQCAKDFMYGKEPSLEHALCAHEEDVSRIIRRCIKDHCLPPPDEPDYASLLAFMLFLRARTAKSANKLVEIGNLLFHSVASRDASVAKLHENYRLTMPNSATQSLSYMIDMLKAAADLRMVLLDNTSPLEFLTSDHPVCFENRFMERRNVYGGRTGLASIGLRIFFPISPKQLIVLYDPIVYRLIATDCATVEVKDDFNVWGINRLQFISAYHTVYLPPSVSEWDASKYYMRSLSLRDQSKQVLNEYECVDDPRRTLVEISQREPKTKLDLPFLRIRRRAMTMQLSESMAKVRNPQLCKRMKESGSLAEQRRDVEP